MNSDNARRYVLLAYLALAGIVTAREVQRGYVPPRPGAYVAGAIGYTVLGGLAEFLPGVAVAAAVLLDIGAAMTPVAKGTTPAITQVAQWLETLTGGSSKTPPNTSVVH